MDGVTGSMHAAGSSVRPAGSSQRLRHLLGQAGRCEGRRHLHALRVGRVVGGLGVGGGGGDDVAVVVVPDAAAGGSGLLQEI